MTLRSPVLALRETSPAVTILRCTVASPSRIVPRLLVTLTGPLVVIKRPRVMSFTALKVM